MKIQKTVKLNNYIKKNILRCYYFSKLKKKGRKLLMLLKKQSYIQVGLDLKRFKTNTKYLLYKTLNINFHKINKKYSNNDYLNILKNVKIRNDYFFNFNKIKKVLSIFDLFSSNKVLLVNNLVPVYLTKFQYNLYDKHYKISKLFKFFNLRKKNILYLQFNEYVNYNNLYYNNLYINLKNNILYNFFTVILNYYLFFNNIKILNLYNVLNKCNFKVDHYIKFKSNLKIKAMKVLDKYLMKNKMFRAGKFFHFFLEYMKNFTYRIYNNNLLYGKFKYMKLDGYKYNVKLMSFNNVKSTKLKGWFYIYNYVKRYSYLSYNVNKNKTLRYFVKKYHYFYCFIIKFFYKILYNLKFMFIDKFNFKKILFLKIVIFYLYYKKWYKYKKFLKIIRWKIRKRKIKRRLVRRIARFKDLNYVKFLLRIKSRLLHSKFLSRLKLGLFIRKRKKLNFYKYKNCIRVVNLLLKLRKLKSLKNPFNKRKKWKGKKVNFNFNFKFNKAKNFNKINKNKNQKDKKYFKGKLKQLSNKNQKFISKNINKNIRIPWTNVKRV